MEGKISFYCKSLGVTRQGFHNYLKYKDKLWKYQSLADTMLDICTEDECNDIYGRIRMHQALELKQPDGVKVPSERTVYRIMEETGISHRPKRKPNGITKADKEARKSDDLIKRDFKSDKPLEKCVTDRTEVTCLDGKLYVSAVFDCFDSAVLGLAMDTNMKAIQAKMQAGKGVGYEKWAKVFNLKEAAKTLNFLTDNGLTDYDELAARAEKAGQKFDAASARIKQIEARLTGLSELRTHITNYSKTREIYAAYRKAKNKKEYRLAHESELAMHEAAKKAFDKLGGAKIPTVAQIQAKFSDLLAEKKELYETYKAARKEMIAYQTAKQNVDRLLRIQPPQEPRRETER